MIRITAFMAITAALVILPTSALAEIPHMINYQGLLTNGEGLPLNGEFDLDFVIVNPSTSEVHWFESHGGVPVENGLINLLLGRSEPLDPGYLDAEELELCVHVNGEEVSCQRIASVAYAHRSAIAEAAGRVDWSDITSMPPGFADGIDDTSGSGGADGDWEIVGQDMHAGVSGKVGVGTTTYESKFHVDAGEEEVAVKGKATSGGALGTGGLFIGRQYGVHAIGWASTGSTYGLFAEINGASAGVHYAIYGKATGDGVQYGVKGWTSGWGNDDNYGVQGVAYSPGSGTKYGIYGLASGAGTKYAGYFDGDVEVVNTLSKGGGSFKIDHPLDPQNKYLYHSFVESPDMMNVYNGNVTLDEQGEAWVEMPAWFEALNRDFRYQLTPIGAPGPGLHIGARMAGNRFKISGGEPGLEVSWQVTGIRHDPFAEANRIPVEERKPEAKRGKYLHPGAYNMPEGAGENYEQQTMARREYQTTEGSGR